MIKKPMKAPSEEVTEEQLRGMEYPIACSAKLDGIRALITPSGVLSATKKLLGNKYMQRILSDPAFLGLDGELIVGLPYRDLTDPDDDVFNRTTGAIRRAEGEPKFKFYAFDQFISPSDTYKVRWIDHLQARQKLFKDHPFIVYLEQRICHTAEEALAYEKELLETGYEGMMARTLSSHYKEGRVTLKEGYIYKRKPVSQDEAVVLGVFEQMENLNEKFTDELGNSKRSSHKQNKAGKDTLGGFVLQCKKWQQVFNCGTIIGGTKEWRKEMWETYKKTPEKVIGQTVTFIYQSYGSIDAPRQPRCKAEFRLPEDL